MNTKNRDGFSVLELLITCEIIAILAAVALPEIMRARIDANESAAVANLSQIVRSEITYSAAKGIYGSLTELGASTGEGTEFLDTSWGENVEKNGYRYTSENVTDVSFAVKAVPIKPGQSGVYTYTVTESGDITHEAP